MRSDRRSAGRLRRGGTLALAPGAAVVTGAAGGLGQEIAVRLARRGLVVWATDVRGSAAAAVADRLGPPARGVALDVTDATACEALAAEIAATPGPSGSASLPLTVWVNNAGVLHTGASWQHAAAEWRAMVDVNLVGTMNGTRAALGHMIDAGRGHVVTVVSLAGLASPPGEVVYAASKHGALAFSVGTLRDLRVRGITGVHVSAVCPDGMWTPMLHGRVADPDAAMSWSGRLLRPERVADVVVDVAEHPTPVRSVPRWRGLASRAYDAVPGLTVPADPLLRRLARRRQSGDARRRARG